MGKESWERKMKTIAICNHKGGVGKTALSMAIAEGLHRKGKRTLLVDLDQFFNKRIVEHDQFVFRNRSF